MFFVVLVFWFQCFSQHGAQSQSTSIRVIVTPQYELQPHDSSFVPCGNLTTQGSPACMSGWPRLNARLRQLRSEVPYPSLLINSIDETSRLVMFHPDAYSINNAFAARSKTDVLVIEGFNLISRLETRSISFVADTKLTSMLPLLSNIAVSSVLVSQLVRGFSVVQVGSYKVAVMNMMHSTKTVYKLWGEGDVVHELLPPLKEIYKPDLIVLKLIQPDYIWDDWSVRMDSIQKLQGVDVVIGTSYMLNETLVVQRNGTTYIVQSQKQGALLGIVDVDILTRAVRYKEQNLYSEISPALSDTQEYQDDISFLKTYVDVAGGNDPVIGVSSAEFKPGKITCRIHECEQGNLWASVLWHMAPTPVDIGLINGGSMRQGWPAGPMKLSYLFLSSPFTDDVCVFSMWGSDVWAMMNYSVDAAPRWENDTIGYDGTGRFMQTHGLRVVYNSIRNNSRTRIVALDVWNTATSTYEPVSRRRVYRIITRRYVCDGGDGYGPYIKPTEGLVYLTQKLHNLAQHWIQSNQPITPFLDGHIYRNLDDAATEFIVDARKQQDCTPNTYWVTSLRDCDPCPLGYEQPLSGQSQCKLSDDSSVYKQQAILIATLSVGLTILVIAVPTAWHMTKSRRHLRKVLDNNKVATELAEAVAVLDFEGVAYLQTIKHPNRIQKAFIQIVDQLTNLRTYIPQAVLMKTLRQDDDDDEDDMSLDGSVVVEAASLSPVTDSAVLNSSMIMKKSHSPQVLTPLGQSGRFARGPSFGTCHSFSTQRPVVQALIAVVCLRFKFTTFVPAQEFEKQYAATLEIILALNEKHRAVPTQTCGNDFVITFNAASKCLSKTFHALSYCISLQKKLEETTTPSDLMVGIGTSAGQVSCGDMGCSKMKSFGIIGNVADEAFGLMQYSGRMTSEVRARHYLVAVSATHYKDAMSDFALRAVEINPFAVCGNSNVKQQQKELVFLILRQGKEEEESVNKDNEWMYKMDGEKCRLEFNEASLALVYSGNERLVFDFLKAYDRSGHGEVVPQTTSNRTQEEEYCHSLKELLKTARQDCVLQEEDV